MNERGSNQVGHIMHCLLIIQSKKVNDTEIV